MKVNFIIKRCSATVLISFLMLILSGCGDKATNTSSGSQSNGSTNSESRAIQATPNELKWEYLVVSFGKTSFEKIESNIKNGNSKLVAFQEFADLLSGYEGVGLQTKLDMLGRFGWELVTTIGQIGGDQQLFLRRNRLENRIDIEQDAIKNLTTILRDESAQKEKRLKSYLAEIDRSRIKQEEKEQTELIDLDAKEQRDREKAAETRAEAEIAAMLTPVINAFQKKTKLSSIDVSVTANEDAAKRILYKGEIAIKLDATDALLFENNKYRRSQARALQEDFRQHLLRNAKMTKKSLGDFSVKVEISISYKQSMKRVEGSHDSVGLNGYKGYWDNN